MESGIHIKDHYVVCDMKQHQACHILFLGLDYTW